MLSCQSSQAITEKPAIKSSRRTAHGRLNLLECWRHLPSLNTSLLLTNQLDYSMKKLSRPDIYEKIGHPRPYFVESMACTKPSMTQSKSLTFVAALQKLYLADGNGLDGLLREKGLNASCWSRCWPKSLFTLTLDTWPTDSSLFELACRAKRATEMCWDSIQQTRTFEVKFRDHEEVAMSYGNRDNATDGDWYYAKNALPRRRISGLCSCSCASIWLCDSKGWGECRTIPSWLVVRLMVVPSFSSCGHEFGMPLSQLPIPARGHGVAICPTSSLRAVFARRPGDYFMVFDYKKWSANRLVVKGNNRHSMVTGVYSLDGKLLYATEGKTNSSQGVIGVYDVAQGYRKVEEFSVVGYWASWRIIAAGW